MTKAINKRRVTESKELKCDSCNKPKHVEYAVYCTNCGSKLPAFEPANK
ncbi:hypothetical protein NEY57_000042 [Listeria monocytogenes]|nr:hypothetical protein [Listeria monocytogenes]EHK9296191.1 hypothetical protein [Listeria monocytogenes]EIZ2412615.1 hypothetical protein [Listeria monocytogenes]EIZ6605521.1 hypothetical protein [Listeria monocytogenes]EJH4973625.1 hypothetical protein [Listeria monocytogenes]EJH5282775.1 hypothetical protein [Listeria monocytogenes]